MKRVVIFFLNMVFVFLLAGCGKTVDQAEAEEPETAAESVLQEEAAEDGAEKGNPEEDKVEENTAKEDGAEENAAKEDDIEENNTEEESGELSGAENKYYNAEDQYVDDDATKYGTVKKEHEGFQDGNGNEYFYYDMDCFYFDKTYPAVVNETLQTYYDGRREAYRHDSEAYAGDPDWGVNTPYDSLIFFYVTYAGDDYVSLVFNDVSYMGGAHPDSALEGITIDCSTGEMVDASRFTGDSAEETGAQVEAVLGEDFIYMPEEWGYYITDDSVVFFYYNPRFWDQVATKRVR